MLPPIYSQASEFANTITDIAQLFGGHDTARYQSDVVSGPSGWLVEIHNNQEGFTLTTDEAANFLVQASWSCSSDHRGQWLKVERSTFGVFRSDLPTRPLFRYDFQSDYSDRLPKAHIHFQADHPDMKTSQAILDTQDSLRHFGTGSRRARNRSKHTKQVNVSDLHFPVGGTRFRPSLEDVLLMMIEEYGVVPENGSPTDAVEHLRSSMLEWRKSQARAVIRDMPTLAMDYFQSRGFQLVPIPDTGLSDHQARATFSDSPKKLLE